jgi:transposase-like protein
MAMRAYPRAIRNVFRGRVTHRTNRYLNNHLEQDHRGTNNAIGPWVGSEPSPPRRVSAASLMRSEHFFVPSLTATNPSRLRSAGAFIGIGLLS